MSLEVIGSVDPWSHLSIYYYYMYRGFTTRHFGDLERNIFQTWPQLMMNNHHLNVCSCATPYCVLLPAGFRAQYVFEWLVTG